MNEKFYRLPLKKQQKIIQAAYRVFAQNSYKKSPMREIADAAGISKSLLFHYFHNKKELYLFLWDEAAAITVQRLESFGCYDSLNFFDMIERGLRAKLQIMKQSPDMAAFVIRAYYENEPEVSCEIQQSYQKFLSQHTQDTIHQLNPDDFIPGLNLDMMYRDMLFASEGYIGQLLRQEGPLDVDKFERDFSELLAFWRQIYQKKEDLP